RPLMVRGKQAEPPASPQVYRPQPTPRCLQLKMRVPSRPVTNQSTPVPAAPAVYRPQPTPRVLQTKSLSLRPQSNVSQRQTGTSPRIATQYSRLIRTSNDVVQRIRVYRLGSDTDQNLCPRPGIDDDAGSAGRGLSTSSQRPNTKAQGIETDNLGATLEAVNDHGDHYAIRAADDADNAKLVAWAATRA